MGTWNLALHYCRLFGHSNVRPLVRRSDICSSSYHCTSTVLSRKDSDPELLVWRRGGVLKAALQHRPAVSGGCQVYGEHHKSDYAPLKTPAADKVGRRGSLREWRPNVDSRVSSELQKLSVEDFPEVESAPGAKDSRVKVSRENRNYETLFGVSPCLLALTQCRRKAWRLFVKEGEAYQRPSVRVVCDEAHKRGVQVQRVSKKELDKMCSGRVHQGLCLQASPLGYLSEGRSSKPPTGKSGTPLWLVLDGVQDPMNLGAILRTAYFLGVDRIASGLHNSCPLTPVVSKASSGVMEVMGVYGYESLADMLKVKALQGWQVVGTVGVDDVDSLATVTPCSSFHMTKPTLLLMGGEGEGLSPELRRQCDTLLTIPPLRDLHPGVESLNVSVATGILLHSLLSSRRGGHR